MRKQANRCFRDAFLPTGTILRPCKLPQARGRKAIPDSCWPSSLVTNDRLPDDPPGDGTDHAHCREQSLDPEANFVVPLSTMPGASPRNRSTCKH
jgi:hypothetical protein